MNAEHWLYLATTEIRFPPDREAVRRELESHLEDKKAAYLEQGRTPFEAETAATEDMGDPEEIAKELGRIHRPWWGYIWRASKVLLILAIIMTAEGLLQNGGSYLRMSRPELPKEETHITTEDGITMFPVESDILERWHPSGTKKLGDYSFTVPMVWLEQWEMDFRHGTTVEKETGWRLMACLRADTWRFWEPCSDNKMMILLNVATDNRGTEYTWDEELWKDTNFRMGCRSLSCETWQEPFTTWYQVELYLPGPEAVPEWIDIPIGYGSASVRVDLEREVVS